MKKGVGLIIACICALAIVFVGFFGTRAVGIDPVIYIESVTIKDMNNDDVPKDASGKRTLVLPFEENFRDEDDKPIMQYYFNTAILPENATTHNIKYRCGNENVTFPSAFGGALVIKKTGSIIVTTIICEANDGGPSFISDSITLVVDTRDKISTEEQS
ncbi:MAG: hypothetical protein WCR67_04980 [Bacilli bacterium]